MGFHLGVVTVFTYFVPSCFSYKTLYALKLNFAFLGRGFRLLEPPELYPWLLEGHHLDDAKYVMNVFTNNP